MFLWRPFPYNKVHGAITGPIWGRHDSDGPHVGPMNFAIMVVSSCVISFRIDLLLTSVLGHRDVGIFGIVIKPYVKRWWIIRKVSLIARLMGSKWGPPGSCRPQVGPMLVGPMNLAIWDNTPGHDCLSDAEGVLKDMDWRVTNHNKARITYPDSKIRDAYMGPIWGRQDLNLNLNLMLAPWTLLSGYIILRIWSSWQQNKQTAGSWFKIKMQSYQYRTFHCGDNTAERSSYLYTGSSYTGILNQPPWLFC